MKLQQHFDGRDSPFEGDRTLLLRGLPDNAQIVHASLTVTPVDASGGSDPFAETITFTGNMGDWGVTRVTAGKSVEVDFHARRTLVKVSGSNLQDATLQVDMGGTYVEINESGAIKTNDDPFKLEPSQGIAYLPGLTVNKFKLQRGDGTTPTIDSVSIRTTITNLSLRLGDLAPVWTQVGEMTTAKRSMDFAELLQAYLLDAEVEYGFYLVPFTLHTDAMARLNIDLNVEYLLQQGLLPQGLAEVTLPYAYAGVPESEPDLLQVALPPNARVVSGKTRTTVQGTYDETRVAHGPLSYEPQDSASPLSLLVSPAAGQAQAIALSSPNVAAAVDVLMAPVSATARLQLDLREDLGGKPGMESILSAPAEFDLNRATNPGAAWLSVALTEEIHLQARSQGQYWIVIQSIEGEATWLARESQDNMMAQGTADGGLSWRMSTVKDSNTTPPLTALFRLRYSPDQFQVPVSLQVGSGDKACHVSLDRYQPLGRVDFTLDTPDVAGAFNDYLSDEVTAICAEQETLANGDFNESLRLEQELSHRATIPLTDDEPGKIVVSPDGATAYAACLVTEQVVLNVIDLSDNTPAARVNIGIAGYIGAMSISPEGTRIHLVLENNRFVMLDAVNHGVVGEDDISKTPIRTGAFTADGRYWYALRYDRNTVDVFDNQILAEVITDPDHAMHEAKIDVIEVGSGLVLLDLALAVGVNGQSCFYVLAATQTGVSRRLLLYRLDVARNEITAGPLVVNEYDIEVHTSAIVNAGLTATPCGRRLAVIDHNDHSTIIVDTGQWRVIGEPIDNSIQPATALLAPDGERLYIAGYDNDEPVVNAIDIENRMELSRRNISTNPMTMAGTPNGGRLLIGGRNSNNVVIMNTSMAWPLEWQLTAGRAARLCRPPPFGMVMLLGATELGRTPQYTELVQVVPLVAQCPGPYRLSFWGNSSEGEASVKIIWRGQTGETLFTDEVAIVQPLDESRDVSGAPGLAYHEQRLAGVANATQAEVRIEARGGRVLVDKVSFKLTTEGLSNTGLILDSTGLPPHWQQQPGDAAGFSIAPSAQQTTLDNNGSETVILSQDISIKSDHHFVLMFNGRSSTAVVDAPPPRIEVHWQKPDGSATGEAIVLPVSPDDFEPHLAAGTTPAQATAVRVQLVIPAGTALDVGLLSLRQDEQLAVAQTFLSHAPGELTITEATVVYDVSEPPPVAATTLFAPGSTGDITGVSDNASAYCATCNAVRDISSISAVRTTAGRPAILGVCSECSAGIVRLGGSLSVDAPVLDNRLVTARLPIGSIRERRLPPPLTMPVTAPVRQPIEVTLPGATPKSANPGLAHKPVVFIAGIGERYSQYLAKARIKSIGKLAAIKAGREIDGISKVKLLELKAAAELVLSRAADSAGHERLGEETLADVLTYSSSQLTKKTGKLPAQTKQFQQSLRALLFLLDNEVLSEIKVKDLLPGKVTASTGN